VFPENFRSEHVSVRVCASLSSTDWTLCERSLPAPICGHKGRSMFHATCQWRVKVPSIL